MSFLSTLIGAESSNQNVAGPMTSSGQAQGYYQITTGTWTQFAPAAGVDLSQYPTPLSAPQAVQTQVAGTIPLGRWDPRTLNALTAAGYTYDPNATLAANAAAAGEAMPGFGGTSTTTGASPSATTSGGLLSGITDWVQRGFLIIVGGLVLAFGLWHLLSPATAPTIVRKD